MRSVVIKKNGKMSYYELTFKTVEDWNLYKEDVLDRFYKKIDSSHYAGKNVRIHIVQLF